MTQNPNHACRPNCAACCIAISISPSYPALPQGKAAGERCPHLTSSMLCRLFNQPSRPAICNKYTFDAETCGTNQQQALDNLQLLEAITL